MRMKTRAGRSSHRQMERDDKHSLNSTKLNGGDNLKLSILITKTLKRDFRWGGSGTRGIYSKERFWETKMSVGEVGKEKNLQREKRSSQRKKEGWRKERTDRYEQKGI